MSKLVTRFALLNAVVGIACSDLPSQGEDGAGGGGAGPSGGSAGVSAASGTSSGGSSGTGPSTGGTAGSATGGSMAGAPAGAGGVTGGAGAGGSPGGAPQGGLGGADGGMGGGGMSGAGTGGGGTGGAGSGGVSGAGTGGGGTNTGGTGGAGTGGAGMGGAGTGGKGGAGTGGAGAGGAGMGGGGTSGGGGTAGNCGRPVGACTAPTVRVTDVPVGVTVTGYGGEADTDPLPMAIAAKPSGGSRIAWLGTNQQVYVGELDCDDRLVGTPFTVPAIDLQDLHADDNGGVVLVTRDATGSGTHHCGTGTLCGGTSSPCRTMWMVRFNASGQMQWQTQVTNLTATLDGYQNNARFIWWYQHHGRLAFDGTNYAAYFGVAITVNNGACVDIHEGDRMQVVSGSGTPMTNHADSFAVGCSHSWTTRIVWDPRTSHFVSVCATDNDCRIARPNPYRTIAAGTCDGTLFGGDLVLSTNPGYWTAWSQGGTIRLQHFTDSGPDTAITNAGSSQHPHLVSYGTSRMLLTWGSGTSMTAQVREAGATAATIGSTFAIAVNDHSYQAFKPYSDGSVVYPAAGANNTSLKIARVMPCN